jgi:multiple sugar transport system substrate-binding protein
MIISKISLTLFLLICFLPSIQSCTEEKPANKSDVVTIIFKHGKIYGDPKKFEYIIEKFEEMNPYIKVKVEILPSITGEQHQFYVINLEGKSSDFDVLSMDVIWVPEFARAGWLRDLTSILPPEKRGQFFKSSIDADVFKGRVYAVPWYIDAGILYYRKDLLAKYGFTPPKTWQELVHIAIEITRKEPGLYGFIWQGKQYEGLVCNALEYMHSHGGDVLKNGRVVLNSPENRQALEFMKDLIYKYHVTPPLVTTAVEETTRHIFGSGKAVFMRNWTYAWNLLEENDSTVKGKVGVALLPGFPGYASSPTLGGWQLGVNINSKHPKEAERFIVYLTSYEVQKTLSLTIGYKPTRKELYNDRDLIRAQPFTVRLYDAFLHAIPRPVTPYYMMISQVLQPVFSSEISNISETQKALESGSKQIEFILQED